MSISITASNDGNHGSSISIISALCRLNLATWKTKKGKEQQKLKHVQAGAKQQIRPCGGDVVITY
ncbi:hypothetical protein TYRP_004792 [Tyrophagus putrescentiae]|nr:hypothetical protein TYRP_004792 [Tyrophagus putrescentiae]